MWPKRSGSDAVDERGKKLKENVTLHSKPFTKPGPSLRVRCGHRSLAVVFTELGCHARCLSCGAIGPERPNSETALQALPALRVRTRSRDYGQKYHARREPERKEYAP